MPASFGLESVTICPRIAIVAGSGLDLSSLLDRRFWEKPFSAFDGCSAAQVDGHPGSFIAGECGGEPLIVQQGRRHLYEGLRWDALAAPLKTLAAMGVERVVFTNAAGGLLPELKPGSLMDVERILTWPCRRWSEQPGALVPGWRVPGCDATGIYVWMHGPSYETRAEIAALQGMGASAVGMSTAPEMAAAHALGLRTAAVSCVTNNCCRPQRLSHEAVLATARASSARLCELLRFALPDFC